MWFPFEYNNLRKRHYSLLWKFLDHISHFSSKGVDSTNRMWFSVVCTLFDNHMCHHRGQNIVDPGRQISQSDCKSSSNCGKNRDWLYLVCIYKYKTLPTKNITMESPSILNFQQELQLLNNNNNNNSDNENNDNNNLNNRIFNTPLLINKQTTSPSFLRADSQRGAACCYWCLWN